jgi:hypothetical protein
VPHRARRLNRAIVRDIIRHHHSTSRAEVSSLTGIHRSNMSTIVDQLIEERLVRQKRVRPSGHGRAPIFVRGSYRNAKIAGWELLWTVADS